MELLKLIKIHELSKRKFRLKTKNLKKKKTPGHPSKQGRQAPKAGRHTTRTRTARATKKIIQGEHRAEQYRRYKKHRRDRTTDPLVSVHCHSVQLFACMSSSDHGVLRCPSSGWSNVKTCAEHVSFFNETTSDESSAKLQIRKIENNTESKKGFPEKKTN